MPQVTLVHAGGVRRWVHRPSTLERARQVEAEASVAQLPMLNEPFGTVVVDGVESDVGANLPPLPRSRDIPMSPPPRPSPAPQHPNKAQKGRQQQPGGGQACHKSSTK